MSRLQQRARRLTTQDVFRRGGLEQISGIRLATIELPHAERTAITLHGRAQPGIEARLVEAERVTHGAQLTEIFLRCYRRTHGSAASPATPYICRYWVERGASAASCFQTIDRLVGCQASRRS